MGLLCYVDRIFLAKRSNDYVSAWRAVGTRLESIMCGEFVCVWFVFGQSGNVYRVDTRVLLHLLKIKPYKAMGFPAKIGDHKRLHAKFKATRNDFGILWILGLNTNS